jgi:hypothetical protein
MPEDSDGDGGRVKRVLAAVAVVLSIAAGAVGLLFTFKPELKPCLGETSAAFTGAPVFPDVRYHDHLIRSGKDTKSEPNLLGAEIRFSYQTAGLRDAKLTVIYSVVAIEHDGTLGAVVEDQDRQLAMSVAPESCSESGGHDLFIYIPGPRRRFRVVLELYSDATFDDRLALAETDPFRD